MLIESLEGGRISGAFVETIGSEEEAIERDEALGIEDSQEVFGGYEMRCSSVADFADKQFHQTLLPAGLRQDFSRRR